MAKLEKVATHLIALAEALESRGKCPYCRGSLQHHLEIAAKALRGDDFSLRNLSTEIPTHNCEA